MNDGNDFGRASVGIIDDEVGESGQRQKLKSGPKKMPANRTDLRVLANSAGRGFNGVPKR